MRTVSNYKQNGLVAPTVHLNGTSKDALVAELIAVEQHCQEAIASLFNGMPHDRDYYPQGDGRGALAREQQRDRIARIQSVIDELHELHIAIAGRA